MTLVKLFGSSSGPPRLLQTTSGCGANCVLHAQGEGAAELNKTDTTRCELWKGDCHIGAMAKDTCHVPFGDRRPCRRMSKLSAHDLQAFPALIQSTFASAWVTQSSIAVDSSTTPQPSRTSSPTQPTIWGNSESIPDSDMIKKS